VEHFEVSLLVLQRIIGRYGTRLPIALLVVATLVSACAHTRRIDVIIDHDGGVDDLMAISLLMKSGTARVRTITLCPANSYREAGTRATQLFVDKLGGDGITIARGDFEGTNPFPDEWRREAARTLDTRALASAQPTNRNPVVERDAAHHLADVLSKGRFVILETGPMTNLAGAFRINPAIKKHISRIYVMGGAVRVAGNVTEKGRDGSAEWNIYNNPAAADEVLRSGIAMTWIPLDATNHVPLTPRFLDQLAGQPSAASQLASQSWDLIRDVYPYYFWDTLAAAALLDSSIVELQSMRIRITTTGPSEGRTIEDESGQRVDVAVAASQQRVERMFLEILGRP
jgi:inosine-uridine nucleoside N-ribohydrolase